MLWFASSAKCSNGNLRIDQVRENCCRMNGFGGTLRLLAAQSDQCLDGVLSTKGLVGLGDLRNVFRSIMAARALK